MHERNKQSLPELDKEDQYKTQTDRIKNGISLRSCFINSKVEIKDSVATKETK